MTRGAERLRIISINLRDRDGLDGPAGQRAVPRPVDARHGGPGVLRGQRRGGDRAVRQQPEAELRVVEGGQHFLSATHPDEVNTATVEFIKRWT